MLKAHSLRMLTPSIKKKVSVHALLYILVPDNIFNKKRNIYNFLSTRYSSENKCIQDNIARDQGYKCLFKKVKEK